MAQKDKVKELVGRGLGSYHTKSLQQIDRIEKKNKEQNHKISILTNELDNDYLTKTEEGSVISLEHSKEGMVYLDELQGNTLVNYCSDGSKELTLNGDIDVEGTNVTLREGVDNGLVDVMCEGNTLINMFSGKISDLYGGSYREENDGYITLVQKPYGDCIHLRTHMYKPNTTYTLIVDVKANTLPVNTNLLTDKRTYLKSSEGTIGAGKTGVFKLKFTTIDDFSTTQNDSRWGFYLSYAQPNYEVKGDITLKFILLEGDWSNKEIPQHFEGMKSVGECEDNKIEILSSKYKANFFVNSQCLKMNPNNVGLGTSTLMTDESEKYYRAIPDENRNVSLYSRLQKSEDFESGQEHIISVMVRSQKDAYINIYDNGNTSTTNNTIFVRANEWTTITTNPTNISETDALILVSGVYDSYLDYKNFKLEKGSIASGWMPCIADESYSTWNLLNKKEISLNEPLRGLPNGVKDRIVKIGGKWYVERNCIEVRVTSDLNMHIHNTNDTLTNFCVYLPNGCNPKRNNTICNTLVRDDTTMANGANIKGYYIDPDQPSNHTDIYIRFLSSECNTLSSFENYISENNLSFVTQLVTPTYEPLETEPILNTYTDVTYISNNSIIPCNMKIQNTGYNAIIKPSTLYTVALDTNKSGTVGINLGGAKVTTTNNVATITTPATLTDDSLILHGKGIKASKIRLLEGNKTNWIPSHFEGMKSCFEDKLQDDGSYKMEILSNNKNLCPINKYEYVVEYSTETMNKVDKVIVHNIPINPNKSYILKGDINCGYLIAFPTKRKIDKDISSHNSLYKEVVQLGGYGMQVHKDNIIPQGYNYISITTGGSFPSSQAEIGSKYIADNIMLCTVDENNYEPHKSNKIQFSFIEPLRGVGDVKDRFVLKDGKLMIERNTIKIVLNGSEAWGIYPNQLNRPLKSKCYYMVGYDKFDISDNNSVCDIFSNVKHCYNSADINCFSDYNTAPNKYFTSFCNTLEEFKEYLKNNNATLVGKIKEPTYEEIPFELQKIILEGYENGTLFIDTNIPPTVTTTYAGETPIVKSVRLNKTEVLNNTNDINDNIVPYLMDMDYRVVCLQLEGGIENISMARLFGGTFEMLQRDILSNRYSKEEYKYRLDSYLSANKITHEEYTKLGDMLND